MRGSLTVAALFAGPIIGACVANYVITRAFSLTPSVSFLLGVLMGAAAYLIGFDMASSYSHWRRMQ